MGLDDWNGAAAIAAGHPLMRSGALLTGGDPDSAPPSSPLGRVRKRDADAWTVHDRWCSSDEVALGREYGHGQHVGPTTTAKLAPS